MKPIRSMGLAAVVCALWGAGPAHGQVMTFTSGPFGDGFDYPAEGLTVDEGLLSLPNGVEIRNDVANTLFFDDNYILPTGPDTGLNGEAMWANPRLIGGNSVEFIGLNFEAASTVSFDFAWAVAGEHAPTFLEMFVSDGDFDNGDFVTVDLASFNAGGAFGGFDGAAGRVILSVSDLNAELGLSLSSIANVDLFIDPIATPGGVGEFALDNLTFDGGGNGDESEIGPEQGLGGIRTKFLRNTFAGSFEFDVVNNSFDATTFSVELDAADPGLVPGSPASGEPLPAGGSASTGPIVIWDSDDLLSGTYTASARVVNDQNPDDPDDPVDYTLEIYDPPELSANTDTPVDAAGSGQIEVTNAPAGPHAGALRAGIEITAIGVSGPGFGLQGVSELDWVGPGDTLLGQVVFDGAGLPAGSYGGTLTLGAQMNSEPGSFLNGDPPLPDLVWTLEPVAVGAVPSNQQAVTAGGDLAAAALAVAGDGTGAAILGGTSPTAQTVSLGLDPDTTGLGPGFGAVELIGSPTEVSFETGAGVYVLQITADAAGLSPQQIDAARLLVFDEDAGAWVNAIEPNSNFEADQLLDPILGGSFQVDQTYAEFIAGGGALEPGFHGTAVRGGLLTAWAVVDHNSIFGIAPDPTVIIDVLGDVNGDGFVGAGDLDILLGLWNQNDSGAADLNGDGFIGAGDLDVLLGNWNAGAAPTGSAGVIPEPGTAATLGLAGGLLWRRRRAA